MSLKLRNLMKQGVVCMPGAFNGLVARMAVEKGFPALYVSGAAISASYGLPDIGILTLDYFTAKIREIVLGSQGKAPVFVDADTGFGEVEMVTRTVAEYIHAGAAGLHLEDQQFPKRCGHLDGKSLVSTEDFIQKLKRAKSAGGQDFLICGRTDARGVEGFDAAVARASRYVTEGGADMIFPEGLKDEKEFRIFAEKMRALGPVGSAPQGGPFLLANMTEFGKTDFIPLETFASLGYHVVIYPVSTLRAAMKGVEECLDCLKEKGSVADFVPRMQTRQDLYKTLQYTPGIEYHFNS